jgi:hypothetical protein
MIRWGLRLDKRFRKECGESWALGCLGTSKAPQM